MIFFLLGGKVGGKNCVGSFGGLLGLRIALSFFFGEVFFCWVGSVKFSW